MLCDKTDKPRDVKIIDRQRPVAGIDLAAQPKEKDVHLLQWANERNLFIRKFYQYCKAEGPKGFPKSWSEWLHASS
jgi:hypothetical protein